MATPMLTSGLLADFLHELLGWCSAVSCICVTGKMGKHEGNGNVGCWGGDRCLRGSHANFRHESLPGQCKDKITLLANACQPLINDRNPSTVSHWHWTKEDSIQLSKISESS